MEKSFLQGYGHMVHDHVLKRVRALSEQRIERLASLRSQAAAIAYRDEVRRKIMRAFGPRPRKTPLEARVTGVLTEPGLRIEKIVFASRPGCLVTANLYLPEKVKGRRPAVVGTCGHSAEGKAAPNYQAFCRELVAAGFIVLIYDPFNQGERDQYHGLDTPATARINCVAAHNNMGKQLELLGENFSMWRAWDGIRALDYLLTRPEVDPAHVGVTGNSGGGTLSTWLWALEPRFTMAAPSCFLTTYLANLENEEPQDCEQYPHHILGMGLEMADFMIARAPQPAILIGQRYCFFDHRGLEQCYREVRRIYKLLGAEDRVSHFLGNNRHGYFPDGRAAMVNFFRRHAGIRRQRTHISARVLPPDVLWATPSGEVVAAGARPVFKLIAERARALADNRSTPKKPAELRQCLNRILALPSRKGLPHYRVLRPRGGINGKLLDTRFAIETEADIVCTLRHRTGDVRKYYVLEPPTELTLYLPHLSGEIDLCGESLARRRTPPVYVFEPRGLGETVPADPRGFFAHYGADYMMHGFSLMLGESYLGRRVFDLLRAMDLLQSLGARRMHLAGRGQGALIALFGGILHQAAGNITLRNAPRKFSDWADTPFVEWPAANFPPAVLRHFDLPDCARLLGRRLRMESPWGPDMGTRRNP